VKITPHYSDLGPFRAGLQTARVTSTTRESK